MTSLDETMRHYCEQQARRAGATCLLARQFLPEDRAERAAVTTAFVETTEAIAADVTDPGICATKFEWWRQALAGTVEAGSRHPLIGALAAHDQLSVDRVPILNAHLGAVGTMIDPDPVADADELHERLAGPGAIRSLVVAAADPTTTARDGLGDHGAVSILLRHVAQAMPEPRPDAWWVPMDWRARYADLPARGEARDGLALALVGDTFSLLAEWQGRADEVLMRVAGAQRRESPLFDFLALESGVRLRWLRRIASRPAGFLAGSRSAMRRRDAWFAWRRARRLARRQHPGDQ